MEALFTCSQKYFRSSTARIQQVLYPIRNTCTLEGAHHRVLFFASVCTVRLTGISTSGGVELHSLNAATGAVRWTRTFPSGELNDRPTVDDNGTVYIIFSSDEAGHDVTDGGVSPALTFHAVNAETGAVRWSSNISGAYVAPVLVRT